MQKTSIIWIIAVVAIVALVFFGIRSSRTSSAPYQEFAQCLEEAGVTYYAAWWCPNCQNQKAMFKGGAKYLPEVECAEANRQQNEVCEAAGITAYPTWEFADGSRLQGVQEFSDLALQTGCPLPEALGGPLVAPATTEDATSTEEDQPVSTGMPVPGEEGSGVPEMEVISQ